MITHYITIHAPYGELILSGEKDIETRVRRIPEKFIGKRIGIYEPERGVLIGSVKVLGQKLYATAAAFRKDYHRHRVEAGSQYDIMPNATKIGIIVGSPSRDIFGQRPKKFAPSTIVKNNPVDYGAVVLHNPASSAKTSRPIVPAAAKKINWKPNTTNFDMGGGKYEKLTEYLRAKGVENRVYDEFNRTEAHNAAVLSKGMTDTGTLFNVLNVIPDQSEMIDALRVLKQMVRGPVIISVYEGDGSGEGKTTRDGFQHNKKLEYYLPIVREVFPDSRIYKNFIVAYADIMAYANINQNPKDACYDKVKARYKVFPSAYASGALVQCRKVGAKNWGVRKNPDFGLEKKYGLHGWFMRNRGKGWVDCKTGLPCGRGSGEKRKYPACRPKLSMCNKAAKSKRGRKRISWVKKNPVPPAAVARAAKRGLLARKKYHRGGTAVGVARARDLSRRANVSQKTIDRMYSYFSRHRASRYENAKRISDPTSAARIADDLWGGSAGFRWAKSMRNK